MPVSRKEFERLNGEDVAGFEPAKLIDGSPSRKI